MKSKTSLFSKMMVLFSLMVVAFNNGPTAHANNGGATPADIPHIKNAAGSIKVAHAEPVQVAADETNNEFDINTGAILGGEGWYISDVNILSYKPQPSPISAGNNVTVTKLTDDGVHEVKVYDQLGNEAIQVIRIDKTGPEIGWIDMENGQVASGKMFNIWGNSKDTISLNAEVDISYDNGKTWETILIPNIPGLQHVADCGWTFLWDTTQVPNGTHVIIARSRDVAGNWSRTISLTVLVRN